MVDRMDRVNELIRQEVSSIVLTELKDPRMGKVTVTRVSVSRDLHFAKVYFTVMADERSKERIVSSLESAAGHVRRILGSRIRLRYIPKITFLYDTSFDAGERVFEIMRGLKHEAALGEGLSDDANGADYVGVPGDYAGVPGDYTGVPGREEPDGEVPSRVTGGQRDKASLQDVIDVLERSDRILVTTHVRPDGDAVGCLAALGRVLIEKGKTVSLVLREGIPGVYRFLTHGLQILEDLPEENFPEDASFDAAVLLDVATFRRAGADREMLKQIPAMINIDHHGDNECYGTLNLVCPDTSSTGEILYDLFSLWEAELSVETATALYAAIMTDCGRFSYENTTPGSLRAAAVLLESGMDVTDLSNRLYNNEPLPKVRLIGSMLSTMEVDTDCGIVWCEVDEGVLQRAGATFEHTDDVVTSLRSIDIIEVALLFKEVTPDLVNVSMRSKGAFDVALFAQKFGGGGHRRAAGCTIKGTLLKVRKNVLKELRQDLCPEDHCSSVTRSD